MRRHVGDVFAADEQLSRRRPLESGEQSQQRRLAAAGAAEQRETLAFGDVERNVVHGDDVAEAFADAVEANQRFGG